MSEQLFQIPAGDVFLHHVIEAHLVREECDELSFVAHDLHSGTTLTDIGLQYDRKSEAMLRADFLDLSADLMFEIGRGGLTQQAAGDFANGL